MSGPREPTKDELLAELQALRRRNAELEASAIQQRDVEETLMKDARTVRKALQRSEATEQALLEAASEGIVLIDQNGRIILVNAALERLFGYGRAELLGHPLEMLLPERARSAHLAHRLGYFAEPRVRPMGRGLDLAGRRRDGAEFPVEISLSHLEAGESGLIAMAFISDISERKRADAELHRQREALHQQEKLAALGTLAAGVAHEINNPIGIITSRIELMLLEAEEQHLSTTVVDDLRVLLRNAQRVGKIATGLRSFTRHRPEERRSLDINVVIEETLLLMRNSLVNQGIRVGLSLDPALPPLLGDADALQQVLVNLLTNAREAMRGEGEIRIETSAAPDRPGWLRVVVVDTGPGIRTEDQARVFEPFYTTKSSGTGLGLSVSAAIVHEHQGTVEVRSEPGRGTTIVLTFPVSALP
jgi:PAS domain S-box-containing protein